VPFNRLKDVEEGEKVPLIGGFGLEIPPGKFNAPNLTPDPETGHIKDWTEEQFIQRFKSGRVYKNSSMPWAALANMDTIELKAIYAYLKSLDPVKNKIEAIAINLEKK